MRIGWMMPERDVNRRAIVVVAVFRRIPESAD